ncbi:hypothetical protein [Nocardioides flavescens]|uniref:Uncharacterized protein n=1 Tax=Nocardioides flavescens TaxID=2691959 RepID=A0A6L7F3K8_9ACTN|nr:hypothetical protein [Nocardioides flavescens]MXG91791.1 hypothetical protein [Nocardioides flavescens]
MTTRRTRAAAVGVVVLALLLGCAWWVEAGRSAAQVAVTWTPTCTGTELTRLPRSLVDPDDPRAGDLAIDVRPGFACSVRLRITNTSRWTAHLEAVRVPFAGRSGGGEMRAEPSPAPPALQPSPFDDIDATLPVVRELAPGESTTVEFRIGWREDGCNAGGAMWVDQWPAVELRILARDLEARSPQRLVLRTHDGDHQPPAREGC